MALVERGFEENLIKYGYAIDQVGLCDQCPLRTTLIADLSESREGGFVHPAWLNIGQRAIAGCERAQQKQIQAEQTAAANYEDCPPLDDQS